MSAMNFWVASANSRFLYHSVIDQTVNGGGITLVRLRNQNLLNLGSSL